MDNDWKCIVLDSGTNGELNEALRSVLISAAAALYHERQKMFVISNEYCDGVMTTEWRECVIERIAGFSFKAKMQDAVGYHELSLLIAESELKRGAEILEQYGGIYADLSNRQPLPSRLAAQAKFILNDTPPSRLN